MRRSILLLAFLALSCRVPGKHVRTGPVLPAREKFCDVRTYEPGVHPAGSTVVGQVESEADDRDTLLARLQSHACFLGADGLMRVEVKPFTISKEVRDANGEWKMTPVGEGFRGSATAVLLSDPTPVRDVTPAPFAPSKPAPPPPPPPPPPRVAAPDAGLDMGDDVLREKPDAGTPDAGTPDAGTPAGKPAPDAGLDEFGLPPLDMP